MKKCIRFFAFAMSVVLAFASFVFAADAADMSKILDQELIDRIAAASEDEIIDKIFVGLETGFDKAEFESKYGVGEEYISEISAFFQEQSARFIEKLPEDLKADIDHIDPYAACIWFNTTANNIYRLTEYKEVTGIGYGEYTVREAEQKNEEETTEPPYEDVPLAPLGDVDLDMKVTAADAREILRYAARLSNKIYNKENADVNADGKINAADARLALKISAKLEPDA